MKTGAGAGFGARSQRRRQAVGAGALPRAKDQEARQRRLRRDPDFAGLDHGAAAMTKQAELFPTMKAGA